MQDVINKINELANGLGDISLMEVCGGHTNVILKYGIRKILPSNIKLLSGPGCPVCVTSQKEIDSIIEMALNGIKIVSYGDMVRVPGTKMSLEGARGKGADVKIIDSASQALNYKDHVFFGIGFETTAPMTAYLLKKGLNVFSAHRLLKPAMKVLLEGEIRIDGFIMPGHVSVITGADEWKELNVPQVISGFTPELVMVSICKLLELIKNKQNIVVNNYDEAVLPQGNIAAKNMIKEQLKPVDAEWRGFGMIKSSALEPVNDQQNARIIYVDIIKNVKTDIDTACRCGDVVKGLCSPHECPLFGDECSPQMPRGACMVSDEGACRITYVYER
ncbi:MAG: hydrogenase formation protein HypD [Nanoarchaeota archaeon]|nr:hydrogenase formation protein HypD [Nanoarchaeota archaeon]